MRKRSFLCLHDALISIDQILMVECTYDEDDQPAIKITYGNRKEFDYYQNFFESEAERNIQFEHITKELEGPIIDEHGYRVFLHTPNALIRISKILAIYKFDKKKGFAIKIELSRNDSSSDYWHYYDTENERDQDFERMKNDIMTEGVLLSGFYVADGSETNKDGKPVFERKPISECMVDETE